MRARHNAIPRLVDGSYQVIFHFAIIVKSILILDSSLFISNIFILRFSACHFSFVICHFSFVHLSFVHLSFPSLSFVICPLITLSFFHLSACHFPLICLYGFLRVIYALSPYQLVIFTICLMSFSRFDECHLCISNISMFLLIISLRVVFPFSSKSRLSLSLSPFAHFRLSQSQQSTCRIQMNPQIIISQVC